MGVLFVSVCGVLCHVVEKLSSSSGKNGAFVGLRLTLQLANFYKYLSKSPAATRIDKVKSSGSLKTPESNE